MSRMDNGLVYSTYKDGVSFVNRAKDASAKASNPALFTASKALETDLRIKLGKSDPNSLKNGLPVPAGSVVVTDTMIAQRYDQSRTTAMKRAQALNPSPPTAPTAQAAPTAPVKTPVVAQTPVVAESKEQGLPRDSARWDLQRFRFDETPSDIYRNYEDTDEEFKAFDYQSIYGPQDDLCLPYLSFNKFNHQLADYQPNVSLALPVLIQLHFTHPTFGPVDIIACLWYVDVEDNSIKIPQVTNGLDRDRYRWLKNEQGGDLLVKAPVRVCCFHRIIEIRKRTTPLQQLVGQWFSSFNVSCKAAGLDGNGWDQWRLYTKGGAGPTMATIFDNSGYCNPKPLNSTIGEIGCNIPPVPARDFLALMCTQECNELTCVAAGIEAPCQHGVTHRDVDTFTDLQEDAIKKKTDEESSRKKAPGTLTNKLKDRVASILKTKWGRRITFECADARYVQQPVWSDGVWRILNRIHRATWPGLSHEYDYFYHLPKDFLLDPDSVLEIRRWFQFNQYTADSVVGVSKYCSPETRDNTDYDNLGKRVLLTTWTLYNPIRYQIIKSRLNPGYGTQLFIPMRLAVMMSFNQQITAGFQFSEKTDYYEYEGRSMTSQALDELYETEVGKLTTEGLTQEEIKSINDCILEIDLARQPAEYHATKIETSPAYKEHEKQEARDSQRRKNGALTSDPTADMTEAEEKEYHEIVARWPRIRAEKPKRKRELERKLAQGIPLTVSEKKEVKEFNRENWD